MDEGCWGGNGDGLFQYVRCDGSWEERVTIGFST